MAGGRAETAPLNLRGHLPVLDGIRGIAILAVMIFHMTVMVPRSGLDLAYVKVLHLGRTGVDLFFVLSGFLITGILFDSKGSPGYFRRFYARRVLRIFPLYYAIVAFSLLVLPHIPNPKAANFARIGGDEGYYWFFLQNYVMAIRVAVRHGILDVTWSLAIEEQFYVIWPAVVAMASRRRLMQICVGLVAASTLLRAALYLHGSSWFTIYALTPTRMDGLAAGAFVALWMRGEGGIEPVAAAARKALAIAGPLTIGMFVVYGPLEDAPGFPLHVFGYVLVSVVFACVLALGVAAPRGSALSRTLESPFLRFFGVYSYALYLFHLPLRAVIRDAVFRPSQFFEVGGSQLVAQAIFYVLATALASGAALASFHLFEKHFLKLKRRFEVSAS